MFDSLFRRIGDKKIFRYHEPKDIGYWFAIISRDGENDYITCVGDNHYFSQKKSFHYEKIEDDTPKHYK